MPKYNVHCTTTVEIYATIEADNRDEAEHVASNITIVNYANETVGAETDDGEITEVIGHEVAGITITGGE
tara:strand:- start:157 stop:366 length:210 start_codon:yes stop_codon:yes gene_type:complete